MSARLSRVRWYGFLSLVMLTLFAFGCDQLTGGSKSKKKSDRSSKVDDDDDDDDSKSKKKKKKKKSDDESEEEDKPAGTETAKPAVPTPPPPPPQAEGEFPNAPTCDKYMRVMKCLIAKMPADSRASMEDSVRQMRDAFKQLGPQAESTCAQALSSTLESASQLGCNGDAVPSTPTDTPPPSPPPSGGNSSVPTTEEWEGVTREVTVRGSGKLNCETKMVREWLRVSCKGKNFTGGEPKNVTVTSGGGRGEDFAFNSSKVASVVVRFVEGVNLEATFTWTDRTHVLKVYWPRGAPEPPAKGVFIGAD